MEKLLRKLLPGGRFKRVSPVRSRTMAAVKGRDNKTTERRLRFSLFRAGVSGWKLRPHGVLGNPDVIFPERRLAVFVDGCFWHGCPRCGHYPNTRRSFWRAKVERNRWRDRRNTRNLRAQGWRVLRVWEHLLATGAARAAVVERIRQLLSTP